MFLDDRKRRILQAIIDDYIDTAEPIGSRTIARKHELGLSSATIRNEMADLEEMGFLAQPHTSSGRIPSEKGYRIYVDQLMQVKELCGEDIEVIKTAMETGINELSQLLKQASAVMSQFTRYTSIAISPKMKSSTIKAIQVVPIEKDKSLVVVVTSTGTVRNKLIKLTETIEPHVLIRISNSLNNKLSGLAIEQVNLQLIRQIEIELGISRQILFPILEGAADCINQIDDPEVYMEGAKNIFNYPEFSDLIKVRDFMSIMDEKDNLCKLLAESIEKAGITVRIGSENNISGMNGCSLITANYNLGNSFIGSIGIIGPTRMEYPRVISSINYVSQKISQEICRMLGVNPGSEC